MKKFILTFIIGLVLLSVSVVFADEVSFSWDANPESDNISYYTIYWSSVGSRHRGNSYENSQNVGNVTTYDLEIGNEAWIAITASGDPEDSGTDYESDYSRELYYYYGQEGKADRMMIF